MAPTGIQADRLECKSDHTFLLREAGLDDLTAHICFWEGFKSHATPLVLPLPAFGHKVFKPKIRAGHGPLQSASHPTIYATDRCWHPWALLALTSGNLSGSLGTPAAGRALRSVLHVHELTHSSSSPVKHDRYRSRFTDGALLMELMC